MLKYKEICIDIYRRKVILCIGEFDEFKAWADEFLAFDENHSGLYDLIKNSKPLEFGKCYIDDVADSIILIRPWNNIADLSNLVHETGHAAIGILDYLGIPINWKTDEAFTYLQEYIFKEAVTDDGYITYDKNK